MSQICIHIVACDKENVGTDLYHLKKYYYIRERNASISLNSKMYDIGIKIISILG